MGVLRFGSTLITAALLVAVNLVPLVGVAFWGWSLMLILVLYWLESGIIGVINVFKIARASAPAPAAGDPATIRLGGGLASGLARGGLIGFFLIHYGMFWLGHGFFIFLLPLFAGIPGGLVDPGGTGVGFGPADFGPVPIETLGLATITLAASHGLSYVVNYLGRGEYLRVTPQQQMMSVYGRVFVLHVTIIGGAFAVGIFGTPLAALVLLVALKTGIDLVLHLREHRAPSATGGPAT
jgi:hypothetical protein